MTSITTTEVVELHPISVVATPNPALSEHIFEPSNRLSEDHDASNRPVAFEGAPVTALSEERSLSNAQLVMMILQPSVVNFFGSFTSGIITVGLPVIASSISLERSLYLWPASVYSLTCGAALLVAGSITDIIGARHVEVCSIFFLGLFILVSGFSQTGIQLVVFRAIQGIALAVHIPASVSIISSSVPAGRARNIGFGCLGLSQPLGFSFGSVISGIMIERLGWRSGFYLSGAGILTAAAGSWMTLPKMKAGIRDLTIGDLIKRLWKEVDWVGGCIAGSGLSLLSYVFA
jgi:MFS family permease